MTPAQIEALIERLSFQVPQDVPDDWSVVLPAGDIRKAASALAELQQKVEETMPYLKKMVENCRHCEGDGILLGKLCTECPAAIITHRGESP